MLEDQLRVDSGPTLHEEEPPCEECGHDFLEHDFSTPTSEGHCLLCKCSLFKEATKDVGETR